MRVLLNPLKFTSQALMPTLSFPTLTGSVLFVPILSVLILFGAFRAGASEQAATPEDESGILDNGNPVSVSTDTSPLVGTWGKCLKSVDTRCYFMSVGPDGATSILTYISSRDQQFGADPAEKPYCYSATERRLARLGKHTYIWQDILASGATVDPHRLMKIVTLDNALLLYSGDKLQLSLPAVDKEDAEKLAVC